MTSTTFCPSRYFAGPAVEVDHHDVLLGVQLGAVHVEVEAVLVPDGVVGGGNRKFETSSCRLVVVLAPVCVPRQSALRPGGGQGDVLGGRGQGQGDQGRVCPHPAVTTMSSMTPLTLRRQCLETSKDDDSVLM